MKLTTFNSFGKISISNKAIAKVAGYSALDCYGVLDLVSPLFANSSYFAKKNSPNRGIVINRIENDIIIHVYAIFKYGVAISAVSESIKKTIKYNVEGFTGMIVREVNVHVVGVRV